MPRTDQDFTIYQNAVEIIVIAVKDASDLPIDLTTFDELCWIMTMHGEIVRYTTTDPGMAIVDADDINDGIRLTIPDDVTKDLECGRLYRHQLWGTFNDVPRPISVGAITVERGDGC